MIAARAMKRARLFVVAGLFFGSTSCGTDAVGVDECRTLELARCEEANACGFVEDVGACQRYYRNHCLHGLATSTRPAQDERDRCVEAIRRAGACAREEGPETPLASCAEGPPAEALPERTLETTCDVVRRPWETSACAFLNPPPSNDDGMGQGGAEGADE